MFMPRRRLLCACRKLWPQGLTNHGVGAQAFRMQGSGVLTRTCQIKVAAHDNLRRLVATTCDVGLGVERVDDMNARTRAAMARGEGAAETACMAHSRQR